jgi:hypothetical protein
MRSIDANTWHTQSQPTSVEAMNKTWGRTGTLRRKVFEAVKSAGGYGMTDDELMKLLKIDGNSLRPSRITLTKDGWLYDSGEVRINDKGNKCVVWKTKNEDQLL